MSAWQASRPGDRILQLDLPLSYGIFDHFQDSNALNSVQFLWDPTKEVGVYIKVSIFIMRKDLFIRREIIIIFLFAFRSIVLVRNLLLKNMAVKKVFHLEFK